MSTSSPSHNDISIISTPHIMASDTTPFEVSEDSTRPQEHPNRYKLVGPYDWVMWTEDGTLTSAWALDRDSESDEDTSTSGSRAFSRTQMSVTSMGASDQIKTSSTTDTGSSNTTPHHTVFQQARRVFDELKDEIWEDLFNRYLETTLQYFGEEDENAEKERHEVKEILFDEMRCIFDTLEEKCNWLEKGVREMGQAIRERGEKEKIAISGDESKGAEEVVEGPCIPQA